MVPSGVWKIRGLEKADVTLDFSSAELGECKSKALIADGTPIVNALTLIEMDRNGNVQVIVCSSCGIVQCEPGSWVQPRRVGDGIVWLPCFELMDENPTEYRPPDFFATRGAPFFDAAQSRILEELAPLLAAPDIPLISRRDVALLTQWSAPCRILGEPGEALSLRRDHIIATSIGDVTSVATELESLLREALSDRSPFIPVEDGLIHELYVSDGGAPSVWSPLALDSAGKLELSGAGLASTSRGHASRGRSQ